MPLSFVTAPGVDHNEGISVAQPPCEWDKLGSIQRENWGGKWGMRETGCLLRNAPLALHLWNITTLVMLSQVNANRTLRLMANTFRRPYFHRGGKKWWHFNLYSNK